MVWVTWYAVYSSTLGGLYTSHGFLLSYTGVVSSSLFFYIIITVVVTVTEDTVCAVVFVPSSKFALRSVSFTSFNRLRRSCSIPSLLSHEVIALDVSDIDIPTTFFRAKIPSPAVCNQIRSFPLC